MLSDKDFKRASPIFQKEKQIDRVYQPLKDAKTLKMYAARELKTLMQSDNKKRIHV